MSDLRSLYQEIILDHNKSPRNFGLLDDANRVIEGYNPLCGDRYTIYINLRDGKIEDIRFSGVGCAISKASASVMTSILKGKSIEEAEVLFEKFHALVTKDSGDPEDLESLGKLAAFGGVSEFPARVKCATLAWHSMKAALHSSAESVSTE